MAGDEGVVRRIHVPGRHKPIALRGPCLAQAQGAPSLVARATHASHRWGLRAKLSVLLQSGSAQKGGDLPIHGKPRSAHAPSPAFHAPAHDVA